MVEFATRGKSDEEIAQFVGVSPRTLRRHCAELLKAIRTQGWQFYYSQQELAQQQSDPRMRAVQEYQLECEKIRRQLQRELGPNSFGQWRRQQKLIATVFTNEFEIPARADRMLEDSLVRAHTAV